MPYQEVDPTGAPLREVDSTGAPLGRSKQDPRAPSIAVPGFWQKSVQDLVSGGREIASDAVGLGADVFRALAPTEEGARAGGRVVGKLGDITTFITGGLTSPIGLDVPVPGAQVRGLPGAPTPGPRTVAGLATGLDIRPQPRPLPAPQLRLPPPETMYIPGQGWTSTGQGMIPGRPGAIGRPSVEQPSVGPGQAPVVVRMPRPTEPPPVTSGVTQAIIDDKPDRLQQHLAAYDYDPKTVDRYRKVILPGRPGGPKRGFQDIQKQDQQILTTVDQVIANKQNLKFADEYGLPIEEPQLPQTVRQFAEAITQTKDAIFAQYDALAARTQSAGVRISMAPAAAALREQAQSFVAHAAYPGLADQLLAEAQRIEGITGTPREIQELIKDYNSRLQAFFNNPNMSEFSGAATLGAQAKAMRQALDNAITASQGTGYQELKDAYGALRETETSVANAIVRIDKRIPEGLVGRLGDFFAVEELARFVLTGDPHALVRGITSRAARSIIKKLNDPNRAVQRMFQDRERRLAGYSSSLYAQEAEDLSARVGTTVGNVRQRLYDVRRGDLSRYFRPDQLPIPPQ